MDNGEDKKGSGIRYRGSLVGPVILITIGLVFLLSNIGYLTGDIWDTILNLWPLILVAIGLDSVLQKRGVAGPALFIGLGIIFLLSNFGLLGWNVWDLIVNLWPILLIAIGLDIVLGRRSIWGAVLALILILVILTGALFIFDSGLGTAATEESSIVQPLQGVTEANVALNPSVGSVIVKSLSSSENLLEGTVHLWKGETFQSDYRVVGEIGEFSLESLGASFTYPTSLSSKAGWDLRLIDDIPINLDLDLGVGEAIIDLSSMTLDNFSINVAVGKVSLILPNEGIVSGDIDNSIGSILVSVPQDSELRLKTEIGLTNIQLPPGFRSDGNVHTSPGYDSGENRINLSINQAIGLVKVEIEE
jgi:hypothetical protein